MEVVSINHIAKVTNEFLVDEFEVDANLINPDADLKETLDLDSLDYVDLVVMIEANFGVKLEGKDFKGISTFGDFYQLIYSKLQAFA